MTRNLFGTCGRNVGYIFWHGLMAALVSVQYGPCVLTETSGKQNCAETKLVGHNSKNPNWNFLENEETD